MSKLTDQFFERDHPNNYKDVTRQKVYLKDIDCPDVWKKELQQSIPPNLFYLNDNTGKVGGPGSVDEPSPLGGKKQGRGIAISGDLMSSLPQPMRAENLMCYVGHEGTYTPAHREMCASLGHNIMVEASDVMGEAGQPERPGSSIWFMTESKDRHMVAEYWMSILGHDIEVEKHFAQINAWKKAPFTTYIVEQKPGDLILIPPLAPHQVFNRGTRTMKVAWNRTTIDTLEMAFREALPNARMVCRDEQYKNKAIAFFTLKKYAGLLKRVQDQRQTAASPQEANLLNSGLKIQELQKDFKRLFRLYRDIMLMEMFAPEGPQEKKIEYHEFESNITCAYCRCNIFNRFLTCPSCDDMLGTTEPEPYDVCMDCYAMGRSCACISKLKWAEQFKWKELVHQYEIWRRLYIELKRTATERLPLPIQEERARLNKKTLAQICQEQLKRRPWTDVHKKEKEVEDPSDGNEEINVNDDGTVRKTTKRRSEAWLNNNHACHVCCHRHPKWKMAECKCGRWFCYGTLFRGFDLMPQAVMEDPNFQCPHCRGICSAGACRKDPRQTPYEPKGTLLGHDTKKVADVRSVESLVDFGVGNLNWLQETKEAPTHNSRLQKRQQEADRAKLDEPSLDMHDDSGDEELPDLSHLAAIDPRLDTQSVIDPALGGPAQSLSTVPVSSLLNGDGPYSGYAPATQSEFVAPAAVMLNPPQPDLYELEDATEYPDPEEVSASNRMTGSKRKPAEPDDIQRRVPKKRRNEDGAGVTEATKEYRKQQERRAIEEAKKAGRFIAYDAALKGRQKIIKLSLPSQVLRGLVETDISATAGAGVGADGVVDEVEDNVLIRSDINKPKVNGPAAKAAAAPKAPKAVRIRVERDADFHSRIRNRKSGDGTPANAPSNKKKPMQLHYEQVDVGSDDEMEEMNELTQLDGAVGVTKTGKKTRRISAWQAQKHNDAAVLEELPDDFKDGRKARKSLENASVRRASAGKSTPQIRPTAQRVAEAVDLSEDEDDEDDQESGDEVANPEEENRLAKIEAARLFESDQDEDEDEDEDMSDDVDDTVNSSVFVASTPHNTAPSPVMARPSFAAANARQTVTSTPKTTPSNEVKNPSSAPAATGSILSRNGPGGRKIKIVSKAKRATIGGALPSSNLANGGRKGVAKSSPMPVKGVVSNLMASNGRAGSARRS